MAVDSSRELALFLEKMRFLRGVSQEDFTDGIISNRQYQRYVRGESPMPFHLIDLFAERLNVSKDVLLLEFENHTLKETLNIINYFSAMVNKDYKQMEHYKALIDPKYIIDPNNRKTYEFTQINEHFLLKRISKEKFKIGLISLIDYPKILSQTAMSIFEVNVLSQLMEIVNENEQTIIANKIRGYLENPDLVWSGNQLITFNVIIFRLAKFYGVKEDYKNVISAANFGKKINLRAKSFNNLDYYYYFLSLSHYRLSNQEQFKESLFNCYIAILINNNPARTKVLVDLIESDFGIDYKAFILDYLKQKPGL